MAGEGPINYDFYAHLKQNMQATSEEIDYIKQLHQLRSKHRLSVTKDQRLLYPSMIIDDFLYHGDYEHASNTKILKELDIRHIISVCDFPLGKDMFDNYNILWIKLDDMPHIKIHQCFDQTNEFLHTCKNKNERVLVHCQVGISRSSSIVLAYLLKYHYDTLREAYDHLVQRRLIALPNTGFFLQLIRYEDSLRKDKPSEIKQSSNCVSDCYQYPV